MNEDERARIQKHRITPIDDVIGELKLIRKSGESRQKVVIQIGRPYLTDEQDYACPVALRSSCVTHSTVQNKLKSFARDPRALGGHVVSRPNLGVCAHTNENDVCLQVAPASLPVKCKVKPPALPSGPTTVQQLIDQVHEHLRV